MNPQIKDHFYDEFLREPTKDNFQKFMKNTCGELNDVDFKKEWINKGALAKIMLAMANSNGGIIVFGVEEETDGTFKLEGLEKFKDPAEISGQVSKYISPGLDYEVLNFAYDTSVYAEYENKKFQIIVIHNTPERLPFVSLAESEKEIQKDAIYVRRGTKSQKATSEDITRIIERKIATIYSGDSDISLEEHLRQLKILYDELPKKVKVLVRKGTPSHTLIGMGNALLEAASRIDAYRNIIYGTPDEYEEKDNPSYPEENYEAFILRMINTKKLRIEKVLDLK